MTRQDKAINLVNRAYRARAEGHLGQAVRLCKASLSSYPTAEAYTLMGWAHSLRGDLQLAIRSCRQAIDTDPEYQNSYSELSSYLIELQRYDEAIAWLRKAVDAGRRSCHYLTNYNIGRIFEHFGNEQKAIASYRIACAFQPDYAPAVEAYRRLIIRTN